MLGYYISLALRSLRRTPVLSALMVAAIAVGVGAAMTTLTLNYMMSRNALEHKDDVLYALQLDNWDPHEADDNPSAMPWQVTYKDAISLLRSDIPTHQVAMHRWGGPISLDPSQNSGGNASLYRRSPGHQPRFLRPVRYTLPLRWQLAGRRGHQPGAADSPVRIHQ
ncbi:hypothetical protein [Microbulbifer taiwanensis]|uniref:hypothetical protein n=1 Tax=Microbulbifer taiwanensis TaxID=986746 RepID=UPI00361DCB60